MNLKDKLNININIMESNEIVKLNPYNLNNKLITQEEVGNILKEYGIKEEITNLEYYQRAFIHGEKTL